MYVSESVCLSVSMLGVSMCIDACEYRCPQTPKEGSKSPGPGVIHSCEALNVGCGI